MTRVDLHMTFGDEVFVVAVLRAGDTVKVMRDAYAHGARRVKVVPRVGPRPPEPPGTAGVLPVRRARAA